MKELILPLLMALIPTEDDIQIECLREAIYFETRGEPIYGQALVADLIANRVDDPSGYWPDTYCEVIHDPSQFTYRSRRSLIQRNEAASMKARAIAEAIFYEHPDFRGISEGALIYHNATIRPNWDYSKLTKLYAAYNHVFYDYHYTGRAN